MRSPSPAAVWIVSIWSGIGLFDATQTVFTMRAEGMHHAWVQLFATLLLNYLPWALATPLVMRLGRRFPPVQLRPFVTWIIHIALCAAMGVLAAAWTSALERLLNPWAQSATPDLFLHYWLYKFYNSLLAYVFLYGAILAVTYGLDSRERLATQRTETARLNEQLSKTQLDALRRQIEPHFLFNSLNAIAGLMRERRNDAAVSMIAALSEFLRTVIKDSSRQQVALSEEMAFAKKYLEIQKMRLADRLTVTVDVSEELRSAPVPSLILQPMVENAIKHGISKRVNGGAIHISAVRSNGMLTLSVANDGPPLSANWEGTDFGIGLSNVRTRLQSLYGNEFRLTMRNRDQNGVEVLVSVPFRE
jgi:two-component system, LytTR family, sensor kinase